MVQVCEGTKTKNDMIEEAIQQYKEIFVKAKRDFNKVVSVGRYVCRVALHRTYIATVSLERATVY
jgi:hypothetical protein